MKPDKHFLLNKDLIKFAKQKNIIIFVTVPGKDDWIKLKVNKSDLFGCLPPNLVCDYQLEFWQDTEDGQFWYILSPA